MPIIKDNPPPSQSTVMSSTSVAGEAVEPDTTPIADGLSEVAPHPIVLPPSR